MTTTSSPPPRIPMPLRVPELAPSLGQLIVPRRVRAPWIPLDDLREQLATRILELGGRARAAVMREDRAVVLETVSRASWTTAWDEVVRLVAERLSEAIDSAIDVAARRARMPRRRRVRRRLTLSEKRAIAARLASGGGPFISALDGLEVAADRARTANVLDKAAHAEWQESLRTAARRLEAAVAILETSNDVTERKRWEPEIAAVQGWRPALWPVFACWLPVAGTLLWLGLVLGGYVDAPAWLAELLGF